MARGAIHIGTSGWHYGHWRGPFYPEGMAPADFLRFYATHFRDVEINNTFYRLPAPKTLAAWRDDTPPGFVFACKASRYITHMKKLKDAPESTERFFAAVNILAPKLGPVLFQLPPAWRVNAQRLSLFLTALPAKLRYAFEFRDESWFAEDIIRLLGQRNAAFCISDLNYRQSPLNVTADFAYIRLHGPDGAYRGCYSEDSLQGWAGKIMEWRQAGIDVYCYFDNDDRAYAALNAARLLALVGPP